MGILQRYIMRQCLTPLVVVVGGLAVISLLSQGLNQLELIVDQRQSATAYILVTLLSVPLLIALILPLATFFAVVYAVNRMHTENEVAVSFAAGLSPGEFVSPVMKLAALAALAHLAVTVLIQPASYREMRETLFEARNDFVASLVREGEFTAPADGLTVFARSVAAGGLLGDVFIHDSRNAQRPTTYTARSGSIAITEGRPAVVMRDGQVQLAKPDGGVDIVDFSQYTLELGAFDAEPAEYVLKPSDRFLSELFFPDRTYFFDQDNATKFLAEGHGRIASVLLNPALALIALAGLIGGEFSRRGYGRRIAIACAAALFTRLLSLGVQAAATDSPELNVVQYAIPIVAGLIAYAMIVYRRRTRRAVRLNFSPTQSVTP